MLLPLRLPPATRLRTALTVGALAAAIAAAGCHSSPKKVDLTPRYTALPDRPGLPAYLHNTIFERTETLNTSPLLASNYSLLVHLHGTGDSTAPTMVREYIVKEMTKHGFGSAQQPGFEQMDPATALQRDKTIAIVRVDGLIPAGARKGDRFDVQVSAMETPGNTTSSLAHGYLYQTDLTQRGADPRDPGGEVSVLATVDGPVFVNPEYALTDKPTTPAARTSLRYGVIMGRGQVLQDRSIILRLRKPQLSLSRLIEARVNQRFQETNIARAYDEGLVQLFVPPSYKGDWQHFVGVATHLYFQNSSSFNLETAKRLADEAVKPDAKLMDISYAWEGIGTDALPVLAPLMSPGSAPDVTFAAARAAAFIGDTTARRVLQHIALTPDHPFQIEAVRVLGALPPSPSLAYMLKQLIDSGSTLVRVEAYRVLADMDQGDFMDSHLVPNGDPSSAKFILDIVPSSGPPLIFATRRGIPRIAVIGTKPAMTLPAFFSTMDNRLSISSSPTDKTLTIFYRGPDKPGPVMVRSHPDIAELVARLGGEGPVDEPSIDLGYADVVAVLQGLSDGKRMSGIASTSDSRIVDATFVLQDLKNTAEAIEQAPAIATARPQSEDQPADGAARSNTLDQPVTVLQMPVQKDQSSSEQDVRSSMGQRQ